LRGILKWDDTPVSTLEVAPEGSTTPGADDGLKNNFSENEDAIFPKDGIFE